MITTLDLILPFQYFFHLTCLFKYLKVHLNNKQSSALLIYSFFLNDHISLRLFKWYEFISLGLMFESFMSYTAYLKIKKVIQPRISGLFELELPLMSLSGLQIWVIFCYQKKKKKTMEGKKKKLYSLCVSPIIVNYLWSSSLGSRKCEAQRSCIYFWHVLQFESDPYGSLHNCGSEAPTGPNHRLHIKNST